METIDTKRCESCLETKPLIDFNLNGVHGKNKSYRKRCRKCEYESAPINSRKFEAVTFNFTNEEAAYLAGLFDGEGHIGLGKRGNKPKVPKINRRFPREPGHYLHITISNTDKTIIDYLTKLFGEHGYLNTVNYSKVIEDSTRHPENWKDRYVFILTTRKAEGFLNLIKPYSIIKSKQIDVALEYQKTLGLGGRIITEEIRQKRIDLVAQLKSMTKRGK